MPPLYYFPWVMAYVMGFGPILSILAPFDGFSYDSQSVRFAMCLWMAFIHYGLWSIKKMMVLDPIDFFFGGVYKTKHQGFETCPLFKLKIVN